LDTFIQVDKDKWKAFLEELSEFEKKYERLLNMLDMTESRLDALKTPEKKEEGSAETLRQLSVKSPEKVVGGGVKGSFLSRLEAKLEPPGRRSTRPGILSMPQVYASCSRCGCQIVRGTRFCERCGADFGRVVCSCGRELGSGDRFCDRCGRAV
jgi:hypothetical protein